MSRRQLCFVKIVLLFCCLSAETQLITQSPKDEKTFCGKNISQLGEYVYCAEGHLYNDFNNLEHVGKLEKLYFENTKFKDFQFEEIMVSIKNRPIKEIHIESCTNVGNLNYFLMLNQLEYIYIQNTILKNIEKIDTLNGLKYLSLENTSIRNIDSIRDVDLETLNISSNPIFSIQSLKGSKIENIYMSKTLISDLAPLIDIEGLKKLDISDNPIESIVPLEFLMDLEELQMWNVNVSNLSSLKYLKKIKSISMNNLIIEDMEWITSLELNELYLIRFKIKNFSGIEKFKNLEYIYLDQSTIYDLSPLYTMTWLKEIDLTGAKYPKGQLEALKAALPTTKIISE